MNQLNNEVGFEHLHLHSDFSILDGFGTVEEYAQRAKEINQNFLCISDHGMLAAIPRQLRACEKNGIEAIFACELYLQPGHTSKQDFEAMDVEQRKAIKKSYHLLAIAYNEIGYKNLVKLSSYAWLDGYYGRPRVNYRVLNDWKEGIIFTSCCYNSEIGQAFETGGKELADEMIRRYMRMFGKNFYLEIMLLDFAKQKPYDAYIVDAASRFNLPTILTNDCHYCFKEDSKYQRYSLMINNRRTISNIQEDLDLGKEAFELQDVNLWMKSEQELNEKWHQMYQDAIPFDFFLEAKRNTVKIAQKAKGVKIDRSVKLPKIPDAEEKFKEAVKEGFKERGLHLRPDRKIYLERIAEEIDLIRRKDFCSYFLIQKQIVDEARRAAPTIMGWGDGYEAVSVGRGSSAGSLACYCLHLTGVDPIRHKCLFSRFLSENRGRSMKLEFTEPPLRRKAS